MIEQRGITAKEAAICLERIFDDLQEQFHDQWDWINAYFYVEVLKGYAGVQPDED